MTAKIEDTFPECLKNEHIACLRGALIETANICDGGKRIEVLSTIFHLQEDLGHHTYIEDHILVPLVEMLEGKRPDIRLRSDSEGAPEETEELSEREKEVLVLVA